ncbi:MAG: flagellar assembly factor FliW [Paracoccaceae bacterium]|jgi:flagellar assembly factor FliW
MTTAAMPEAQDLNPPVAPAPDASNDQLRVIETRFGPMEFAANQTITMPRGVLGFAEHKEFGIAYLPNKFMDQLMLLQSFNDSNTSFLVLPVELRSGIIEEADLVAACDAMNVDAENAAIVVIVTIRDVGGQPHITTNLRAPIILDSDTRNGWQYVLPNGKYSVRHNMSAETANPSSAPTGA